MKFPRNSYIFWTVENQKFQEKNAYENTINSEISGKNAYKNTGIF